MDAPEFTYEKIGEWMHIVNNSPDPYRKMLFDEQYLQPGFGTTGKYMIFCDDYEMLLDLGLMILIKFQLYRAKISTTSTKNPGSGFAYALAIYDFGPHLKREVADFITDEALSTAYWKKRHPDKPYPYNYRYWKSNKATAEGEYSWQHLQSIGHKSFEGTDLESFKTGSTKAPKNDPKIFVPGMPFTLNIDVEKEEIINV
jgi:hypothetical protein